jgi:hypothetical protein
MYTGIAYIASSAPSSRLEYIAHSAQAMPAPQPSYGITIQQPTTLRMPYSDGIEKSFTPYSLSNPIYQLFPTRPEYHFQPDNFLKPGKAGKFVGEAADIQEFVEDTFEKMIGHTFPPNIKVSVLGKRAFRKIAPSPATVGLSINRSSSAMISEVFVLSGSIGRVLLTLGHELGHVLSPTLENPIDEEAKAYAFSFAWMEIIKEHNIAGLADALILENPAHNGLHDKAFEFVIAEMKAKSSWEVWKSLVAA